MSEREFGDVGINGSTTIRANGNTKAGEPSNGGKGTARGWKDYFWGSGMAKRNGQTPTANAGDSVSSSQAMRSDLNLTRRPGLQDDLFNPPSETSPPHLPRSCSRASLQSAYLPDRKPSGSIASYALRLVAGGAMSTREAESRGRATSGSVRGASSCRYDRPLLQTKFRILLVHLYVENCT